MDFIIDCKLFSSKSNAIMKLPLTFASWHKCLTAGLSSLFFALMGMMFVITPVWATGIYDLPVVNAGSSTWLVDQAEAISLANEGKINGDLKKLAQKTGQEVRFVVIRRLDFDETMPGFTEKLFQRWYPTPEEQANQTLVVIDTLTNGTALYRGVAAQSLVNDEVAESITNETIAVPLKNGGKYNQAVLEADKRLTALLSGQADPGPPTLQEINLEGTFATAEETDDKSATFWVIVLLALATLIPMATYFWYVVIPGR
jgi:uncharacterized protein